MNERVGPAKTGAPRDAVVPAKAGTQRNPVVPAKAGIQRDPVVPAKAGTQRRWLLALALASTLSACSSPQWRQYGPYWPIIPPDLPPPRVVSDAANGSTVDVVRTQWVNVVLPAEGEGPNRWSYMLGKDAVLYPSGDTPRYEAVQGATSGNAIFTFRAEGKGTTSVTFVYRNRDDPQSAVVKSVSFDVVSR